MAGILDDKVSTSSEKAIVCAVEAVKEIIENDKRP